MVNLKNKKIGKMDEYHYIGIPKAFFDGGVLSTDKKYDITITEAAPIKPEQKEEGK